jgi:hypothetical protein
MARFGFASSCNTATESRGVPVKLGDCPEPRSALASLLRPHGEHCERDTEKGQQDEHNHEHDCHSVNLPNRPRAPRGTSDPDRRSRSSPRARRPSPASSAILNERHIAPELFRGAAERARLAHVAVLPEVAIAQARLAGLASPDVGPLQRLAGSSISGHEAMMHQASVRVDACDATVAKLHRLAHIRHARLHSAPTSDPSCCR